MFMATEQEIKLLIPSGTDLSQIIPTDAKHQKVTQVYLSPNQSNLSITKSGDTVQIVLTNQQSAASSTLSIEGQENITAYQELASSPLGIVDAQGKVSFDGKDTEIRIRTKNDTAFLTIKKKTKNPEFRNEFEFEIPANESIRLQDEHIANGTAKIEKVRRSWKKENSTYELDEFEGANEGLRVLEIENPPTNFDPATIAADVTNVTDDKKYGNRQLAENPYSNWGKVYKGGVGGNGGIVHT